MKKLYLVLIVLVLAVLVWYGLTMRAASGDYKEGTYFGFDKDHGYTATIYVGSDGMIKSVLIDAGYTTNCEVVDEEADCDGTTKRILGDDYNMKTYGGAEYEWYEQANMFSEKVVSEQDLDWVEWKYQNSEGVMVSEMPADQTIDKKVYTDAVSGVTVHVIEMYTAVNEALKLAK